MKEHNKQNTFSRESMGFLILILAFLIGYSITQISYLQGTARVVNYAGIVRGGTQRLVKLEMAQEPNDELINKIQKILTGLKSGGSEFNLICLKDKNYHFELDILMEQWSHLVQEIYKVREQGWKNTDLLSLSETFFHQADVTVFAAEKYSESINNKIYDSEIGMIIAIILCILILGRQTFISLKLSKQNYNLNNKVFIDSHTGLPNKNKCEYLLSNSGFLDNSTTCMMFDLNGLKKVNDEFGHVAGDCMIHNFASILRKAVRDSDFVGRYGGDEFFVILYDSKVDDGSKVIERTRALINNFNDNTDGNHLSFAAGTAHSSTLNQCTLKTLLNKADMNMYENKKNMKANMN